MIDKNKTLIIVYKDEMIMNQMKKMIETPSEENEDDVRDNISVVSWTEDVWLDNKKAGNIQGKILFIGDIKGTDKLIPVIDVIYDKYGIKYGWAGNQAVICVDPKRLTNRKAYDSFLKQLSQQRVPETLLNSAKKMHYLEMPEDSGEKKNSGGKKESGIQPPKNPLELAQMTVDFSFKTMEMVGNQVAIKSEEMFRNKGLMKSQMLFFGVVHFYENGLEKFINK